MLRLALLGLGIFPGLFILMLKADPITFESLESKTFDEGLVFNQVQFTFGWDKDIWMMKQSHNGYHAKEWDKLAIVVDKTKSPKEAVFYQMPASADWNLDPQPVAYKARCFACHANGPRAIRWNPDSPTVKPGFLQTASLLLWTLRIKTYGTVVSKASPNAIALFKTDIPIFAQKLPLATCQRCHAVGGLRSPLTYEHIGTANFLVKNGFMPPFPFRATDEEREWLAKWN